MNRVAFFVFFAVLFVSCPYIANADNSCHCGQSVTLKGTIIGTTLTDDNHYSLSTNLTCGEGDFVGVNIKGQGKPPSSCKKLSRFTVSGTVDCGGVYEINIIPSKIICNE